MSRRGFALRYAVIVWALALAPAAQAQSHACDGQAALRIDDWTLSPRALCALQRAASRQRDSLNVAALAGAIVDDWLLGAQAQREPGDAALFEDALVTPSLPITAGNLVADILAAAYADELNAAWGHDQGARYVVRRHPLSRGRLLALASPRGPLLLTLAATPMMRERMSDLVLLEHRFPSSKLERVTLDDVWLRLDVQGRQALLDGDAGTATREALRVMRARFVRFWVVHLRLLEATDLDQLDALMAHRLRSQAYTRWAGASPQEHAMSPTLRAKIDAVSSEEARAWAALHPEAVLHVARVHARHIACPDEGCAHAASSALQQGEPFDDVARRFSTALNRTGNGDMGWVEASDASSWLEQLALAQRSGPPSEPIREPAKRNEHAGWQIVQVLARETESDDLDSEGVRFRAAQAIARERALEELSQLRRALRARARIEWTGAPLVFDVPARSQSPADP